MAKIYISSTYGDLEECREAVYHALRSMGHDVIAMEHYVASDQRPLDKCLGDVAACDLYIGIIAWRYGYVPTKDNPELKSITELEFRHAAAQGISRLLFLLDEKAPWSYALIEQGVGAEKLKLLRDELSRDYTVSFFQTCEQLAAKASAAVANWSSRKTPPAHETPKTSALTPDKISVSRLPSTGQELFGREVELSLLDEAWADPDTNVVSLVAWGGVGKSALVNYWHRRLARDNYRGAEKVYAWSFYRQGTSEQGVSADQFIDAALRWFGDPDPTEGSPWEKGERLARLVKKQRTLLFLDGLEPLQYPPQSGLQVGGLKEHSMQALLRDLAASNPGLCVITSRLRVNDLTDYEGDTARLINLEHLSSNAGAEVLKAQGAHGEQAELEQASLEFSGHALALTLLGSYLKNVWDGDIIRRDEVDILKEDEEQGGHAQRVMTSYEKWFGEGPELAVLRMVALFDRPADGSAINALRDAPGIPNLTDVLQNLSEEDWRRTLVRLRSARLIADKDLSQPDTLDAHPLVREHFKKHLKQNQPDAWREGNNRLYEHLKNSTKEFPDTLEEMTPLFAAVAHGCAAGRYQETMDDIYWVRILRQNAYYSTYTLGAFGADLAIMASFFDVRWSQPKRELDEATRALTLIIVGFALRSMGRLTEAAQPMQAALEAKVSQEDWRNAASAASSLSNLYLTLGNLPQAVYYAEEGRKWADRSGNAHMVKITRSNLAAALHQSGRMSEAKSIFLESEKEQKEYHLLYSLSGFQYCDLLLDEGAYQDVLTRAAQTIKIGEHSKWLLDVALDNLSLGRSYLLKAQQGDPGDFEHAAEHLQQAVNGLRQAGTLIHLPLGLMARAEFYRVRGDFERARADLDETISITRRGNMGLYQADCYLGYVRLYLSQGEKEEARGSLARAKEIIERTGYHRRDGDVREIEGLLGAEADG